MARKLSTASPSSGRRRVGRSHRANISLPQEPGFASPAEITASRSREDYRVKSVAAVDLRLENADERQSAVLLRIIQTVADHESVRHGKPYVVQLRLRPAAGGLVQQRADADAGRVA